MADGFVIKTGIIEETKMLEVMEAMYLDLALAFLQWRNISLEFVDIEKENLRRTLDVDSPEGAEWLFFPCEMALFSTNRSINSPRISLAAQSTSTYILSKTPTKRTVPSLVFLVMKPSFVCCLLASLISVSALMTVATLRLNIWNFVRKFFENIWRNSLLFFFEPFIQTPRVLAWRILTSVWLIAISFIYIDMCSNLKSKFTETKYNYVDGISNLPRDRYKDVTVIKDFVEEGFVNKMAEIDDNYLNLKKEMQRIDEIELLQMSFSRLIIKDEYLIIAELIGKIGIKEMLRITPEPLPHEMVAFSEPLYSTFIAFPIASNASSRVIEAINFFCLTAMEMKIMAKYFNEMDFLFFGMKWNKPGESFEDMKFGDIKSVTYIFINGCILAIFMIIVEYSIALLVKTLSMYSTTRRRHN